MTRYLTALAAAVLALASASAAQPSKKVIIRWHGQSWFEIISTKGTRIVTDPHNLEAFAGITGVKADLVTMSHEHNDHNMLSSVENGAKAKVLHGLKRVGNKLEWNPIDEKFKDVHIKTVGVYHDDKQGAERGKNTVFIFDLDGLRIVHLGDLGHLLNETQIKEIGHVDILMIPVGGVFTINGEDAQKVVDQLKPRRYIFPMHYAIGSFDDVLSADEFLEDQKKENIKHHTKSNEFAVDPAYKPAHPIIVMLNWRNETPKARSGEGK